MIIAIMTILNALLVLTLVMLFVFLGLPMIFPGAPFIPSYRRKSKNKLLTIIDYVSSIAPGKKMVDVGSGDGRVVIEFAKKGYDATGIEFNPFLVFWSKLKIKQNGLKNARIIRQNFWKADFSDYDVIFIFQLTSVNLLLVDKFRKELKTGAIIVSAGFKLFNAELIKQEGIFGVYRIKSN
jgi:SAM-dependent methyltransferase